MGTSLLFLDLTLQTLLVSREHEDLMGYMLYFGPRSKSKTPPRPYKHMREGTCAGEGDEPGGCCESNLLIDILCTT